MKTEEKSNETTAIPRLLRMLELNGCLVTIGAMGCQKEIAGEIVDRGADCLSTIFLDHHSKTGENIAWKHAVRRASIH